ncbi:unnamed protein product [Rotaria magnacalcarata]|uniref:PLAT domain-containing protein n=2 Tax=Rotaria magnacalcarata TaxID=392030 RepID=A0A816NI91_9BILA|nr:unnamed protein product [Rotaria magnacalcarata]
MARVITNNNGNTSSSTKTAFIDRLSHSVIKETSKTLKHYIDVKRRENDFILNPNSSACDSIPLKARFMYGTTKEYPPLYGSYHSDNDLKIYLRSFQKQQKQHSTSLPSPEKQLCRDELNFHMRSFEHSSIENQKFSELRLRPSVRSNSSCSLTSSVDFQKRNSKSASKFSRHRQDQLIDNAANILASMIQTRRSIYEKQFLLQQTPANYDSRNANPSPRQTDDQCNAQQVLPSSNNASANVKFPTVTQEPKKTKRKTRNELAKATYIMHKAKPIAKGILCDYQISVTTGTCNGASTDAPIRVKLYGTHGYTEFTDLVDSETHRVPFLKCQTDVFTIQKYHVGKLAGITIGHDQKDIKSAWFLDKVSIKDPIRSITYDILCNAWLSSKSTDQKTMRDFEVTSVILPKTNSYAYDRQEEIENQSDYSTTSDETYASNSTDSYRNDQFKDRKKTNKHRSQQQKSVDSTAVVKTRTSKAAMTNHLSQPQTTKTISSHSKRDELYRPPVPARRTRSPILDRTPPKNSDNEDNVGNHTNRLMSPKSPLILDQSNSDRNISHRMHHTTNDTLKINSTDYNSPSTRLENRSLPIPISPERPIKTTEQKNEDDPLSFFD